MTCGYEAPHWAHYPDARCIDGYLWDLDSGDDEGLTNGGDVPCPACNTVNYIKHSGNLPSGNARQRRRVLRIAARKVRLWAMHRSSFPCGVAGAFEDRARTLYANSPRAYRGTRPLPWDEAPLPTRLEFIDKAKAEAAAGVPGTLNDQHKDQK